MLDWGAFVQTAGGLAQEYGALGIFLLATAEACFFPLAPDAIMIPMAIAYPHLAPVLGLCATLGSIVGSGLGFLIGKTAGRPVLMFFLKKERFNWLENLFQEHDLKILAVFGLTPLPWKIFSIASGLFGMRLRVLLIATAILRGIRFNAESLAIFFFGEDIRKFLTLEQAPYIFALIVALLLGYMVFRFIRHRSKQD